MASIRPGIRLTSPKGEVFEGHWRGNQINLSKNVGEFKFPFVPGGLTQDLGTGIAKYQLTWTFEGVGHEAQAEKFMQAFRLPGTWEVIHPTKGRLILQPVSIAERVEPINNAAATELDGEWLDASTPLPDASIPEEAITEQRKIVQASATTQLMNTVIYQTDPAYTTIRKETAKALVSYQTFIGPLPQNAASIPVGLVTKPDMMVLGGQIHALLNQPSSRLNTLTKQLQQYALFVKDMSTLPGRVLTDAEVNASALRELCAGAALAAMTGFITAGGLRTKSQALSASNLLLDTYRDMTLGLDKAQKASEGNTFAKQYFSQSETWGELSRLIALTVNFVLGQISQIAAEKWITITSPRSPIEVAAREYKGLGLDDGNFDLFIESNALKGHEILSLPVGRRVVVYV